MGFSIAISKERLLAAPKRVYFDTSHRCFIFLKLDFLIAGTLIYSLGLFFNLNLTASLFFF